jgi:restriction endonuclease S subunit
MQVKKIKLKSIIPYEGLASGYSFRGKITHKPKGTVRIIQLKDFTNNYSEIGNECYLVDGSKIKDKYYLQDGDILFISKGANNFAVTHSKTDNIPTIASSALFVIRVDTKVANSRYVAWYINQAPVQSYFKQNEMGTYITSINKKTVEEIPLKLPPIQVQEKIAALAVLATKEQILYNQIKELRGSLIQTLLLKSI